MAMRGLRSFRGWRRRHWALAASPAWADLLGQPTPGGIDLQPAASPLKHQAIFFHNGILLPIITSSPCSCWALLSG